MTNAELESLGKVIRYLENSPVGTPLDQSISDLLVPLAVSLGFANGNLLRDALRDNPSLALLRGAKYIAENSGGGGSGGNDYTFTATDGSTYADFLARLHDKQADGTNNYAGITSITWNKLVTAFEVNYANWPDLVEVSFPVLDSLLPGFGDIELHDNPVLTNISLPVLVDGGVAIYVYSLSSIVTLSFPSLVTVGQLYFHDNPLLTTISIPVLATLTSNFTAPGCALSAASVDHILSRMVACNVGTGQTVDLSGGTSSGIANLSVQGAADYATLLSNGATVTLNP